MQEDATALDRLQRAVEARDWATVRFEGEAVLGGLAKDTAPAAVAGIHYLVADAILTGGIRNELDVESACQHLRVAVTSPPSPEEGAAAYVMLADLLRRFRPRGSPAFEEALAAVDRALDLLPCETNPNACADARFTRGRVLESLGPSNLPTREQACAEFEAAVAAYGSGSSAFNRGTAAYHAGRMLLEVIPGDAAARARAKQYLETAHRAYTAAGLDTEAADAATLLDRLEPSMPVQDPPAGGGASAADAERIPPELHAAAMDGMRTPELRQIFLQNWVSGHASAEAEAERAANLCDWLVLPALSEAQAAYQEAERRGLPSLRSEGDLRVQDAKAFFDELLRSDAAQSTHDRALDVLRRHLETGERFVLFLRNFGLDIAKAKLGKRFLGGYREYGSLPRYVNLLALRSASDQEGFAAVFPAGVPILAISDISDAVQPVPPGGGRIAKLRVLSNEWDLVVAMLIGEASAIVLFVEGLTSGTKTELDLIVELGAAAKLSAMLVEPDDVPLLLGMEEGYNPDSRRLSFEVLKPALVKRIGESYVQIEPMPRDAEGTQRIVSRVLASAHWDARA
jgi:tetratricopeptide (TPR) repeat protein